MCHTLGGKLGVAHIWPRTGTIGINYYNLDLGAPFGGMKDSGIGRELGPEAINPYLEYKSIFASADQIKN